MRQTGYYGFPLGGGVQAGGGGASGGGGGGWFPTGGPLVWSTTSTFADNTNTAAEFLMYSMPVAGGSFVNASLLRFNCAFQYKTLGSTPVLTVRIRRNGIAGAILFSWAFTAPDTAGNLRDMSIVAHAVTIGPSPSVANLRAMGGCLVENGNPSCFLSSIGVSLNGLDMTVASTFDITTQVSIANINTLIQGFGAQLEVLWPGAHD